MPNLPSACAGSSAAAGWSSTRGRENMDFVKTLLEQQPLMALFLTIAIGYLVGEINIKGFSLGVGAVLFVALAVGWFAPKSAPAPMVGTLLIALTGVLAAGIVSVVFVKTMNVNLGHAMGLFAGSGTSTPTLQAAIATLG